MPDFYEIDFLKTDSTKSADAIPMRYQINGVTRIHVVDGGFQDTGKQVVEHLKTYYGTTTIDAVIVTHPDGDHAGGLRTVIEECNVRQLWMLRPWTYATELLKSFSRFQNVNNLKERLKEIYPNIAVLEQLAVDNNIPIFEPIQGAVIGAFTVLAPSKEMFLNLIIESDKTPEITKAAQLSTFQYAEAFIGRVAQGVISFIRAAWGAETFPEDGTSPENEMSVVQYANLCGDKILLTGDAGRRALSTATVYAPIVGLTLPGIDRIQVPHHGSRHNVSTDILNALIGPKLVSQPQEGLETFSAVICASKQDNDHPRKAVVRSFIHRGAKVITTEDSSKVFWKNQPPRQGWEAAQGVPYPIEQEK